MNKTTIKDELINMFTRQLESQTEKGVRKYGHTLDDCPYALYDWQLMALEEATDLIQYQQKEIRRLHDVIRVLEEKV